MIKEMGTRFYNAYQAVKGRLPNFDEISTSGEDIWRISSLSAYNPDDLAARKGLRVYKEMEDRDGQVKNVFQLKKHARLATPAHIVPASDEEEDQKKARFMESVFEQMNGSMSDSLYKIYNAMRDGYSVSEIVHKNLEAGEFKGKVGISAIKTRKAKNYRFKTDKHGNLEENGLLEGMNKTPLPLEVAGLRKFIIFSYNPDDDDGSSFYGRSDFRTAYRYYFSNDIVQRYWNIFLEKFASPTRYGAYRKGASKAKQTQLYNLLKSMQSNSVVVFPEDLVAEDKGIGVIESLRRADASYELAMSFNNKMIARSMLVGSLLQDEGAKGSYALGKKHFDIFIFILKWIGQQTEENIMHEQIIKPLIDFNFPETEKYPRYEFESLEKEDQKYKAEIVAMLVKAGVVSPEEEWVRHYLDMPAKEEGIILPTPAAGGQQGFTYARGNSLNRAPTTYERKIDFVRIIDTVDGLQEDAVEKTEDAFRKIQATVVKQVKTKRIIENKDYNAIKKVGMPGGVRVDPSEVKKIAYETMIAGYLDGKATVKNELERAGLALPKRYAAVELLEEGVEPTEALAFFKRKIPMTKTEYAAVSKKYKARAFTIAGTEQKRIISEVQQLLENALEYGWSVDTFDFNFNASMEKYAGGVAGQEVAGEMITAHHVETVYRTNINEAFNAGRRAMMEDPEIKAEVPAWQYSAIMDPRTTEICRGLDRKIYLSNNPIWSRVYPPNHYNCRSIVTPIVGMLETFEVSSPVTMAPQKGFYTREE